MRFSGKAARCTCTSLPEEMIGHDVSHEVRPAWMWRGSYSSKGFRVLGDDLAGPMMAAVGLGQQTDSNRPPQGIGTGAEGPWRIRGLAMGSIVASTCTFPMVLHTSSKP
jgi:hypothetical protein